MEGVSLRNGIAALDRPTFPDGLIVGLIIRQDAVGAPGGWGKVDYREPFFMVRFDNA